MKSLGGNQFSQSQLSHTRLSLPESRRLRDGERLAQGHPAERQRQSGDAGPALAHWVVSLQLVKTAELDPSRNYLAAIHPHGVLAAGVFVNMCTESTGFSKLFPGIRPHLMMLSLWFRAPFFRDYIMSGGESPSPGQPGR